MGLTSSIKKTINGIFNKLGYKIIRKNDQNLKWVKVTDPIGHNSMEKINEFYTDKNLLHHYINEERIQFYKDVVALIKAKSFVSEYKTIVDVGCGTGHLLYYLKEEFRIEKATGLEYSPEAINVAKKLFPSFEFYEFDIYAGWHEKFDILVCTEVLEHLLYPASALAKILDMLNFDADAFITVPNGRIDTFGGHINFWSPESWEVFINENTKDYIIETGTMQDNRINYAFIKKMHGQAR